MNIKDVYKRIISDRNTVLAFGKHKGRSIAYLMNAEPEYIVWCLQNEIFDLSPALREEFEQMNPWVTL